MEERHIFADMARESAFYIYRRQAAKERLDRESAGHTYAAILGLKAEEDEYLFASKGGQDDGLRGIYLQKVDDPPLVAELALAVDDVEEDNLYAAMGRYAPRMTHELVITDLISEDLKKRINAAYYVVAAIRIKSQAEILVPAVSNYSWSTIPAVPEGTCQVTMVEDHPRAFTLGRDIVVKKEDFLTSHFRLANRGRTDSISRLGRP